MGGGLSIPLLVPLPSGATTLAIRRPTVRDVVAAGGGWTRTTKTFDRDRQITTETTDFNPAPFLRLLLAVSDLAEDEAEDLSLADVRVLRAALDAVLGASVANVLTAAEKLVFEAEWSVADVSALTIAELSFWFNRAVKRARKE